MRRAWHTRPLQCIAGTWLFASPASSDGSFVALLVIYRRSSFPSTKTSPILRAKKGEAPIRVRVYEHPPGERSEECPLPVGSSRSNLVRLASMVQAVNALGAPRPLAISLDGNMVGLLCSTGLLASDLGSRQRVPVISTGAIAARWQVTVKGAEGRSGVVCGEVIQALRCIARSCINLSVLLQLPSECMACEAPGNSGTHLRERGTTECLLDLRMPISHGMKLIQRIDPC
jgi:hypothetical protein